MSLEARIAESEGACAAMLDRLIVGNAQMLGELREFRAEVAAEFGAFRGEVNARLGALETEQARQGEKLDRVQTALVKILRRLPE